MIRSGTVFAIVLASASALSACSVLPAQAPQPQSHDFGPLPAPEDGASGRIRVDRVVAPAWIDDGAIHYRLVYDDPTSLRSYADHRWAAPPADMLRPRLQSLLQGSASPGAASRSIYALDVDLLEFEQDFPSAQKAEVRLVAEVSLRDTTDGRLVAQKQFTLTAPSTPDVHGAVADLSKLAEQAAEQVVAWCDGLELKDKP